LHTPTRRAIIGGMPWIAGYWALAVTAGFVADRVYRRRGDNAHAVHAALTGLVWPWAVVAMLVALIVRAVDR